MTLICQRVSLIKFHQRVNLKRDTKRTFQKRGCATLCCTSSHFIFCAGFFISSLTTVLFPWPGHSKSIEISNRYYQICLEFLSMEFHPNFPLVLFPCQGHSKSIEISNRYDHICLVVPLNGCSERRSAFHPAFSLVH